MPQRYSVLQIALHWLMAVAIAAAWLLGQAIEEAPQGAKGLAEGQHALIGLLVLALVVPRVLARLRGVPPYPDTMPAWERRLAHAGHGILYLLMIAIPVLGLIGITTGGRPVTLPILGTVPVLFPVRWLHGAAAEAHEVLANLLLPVLTLHVLATLWHSAVRRDGVLGRMIPIGRP